MQWRRTRFGLCIWKGVDESMRKSIVENELAECCFLCGACGYLERHHIFGGNKNRKWSERYGLTVHLCFKCHRDSKIGVHFNKENQRKLHEIGQEAFEREHSRKDFVRIFGINYLEDKNRSAEYVEEKPGFMWL